MENEYHPMQLIYRDGEFNVDGLDQFMQKTPLSECGLSYAVVAIMGAQSGGKSTLLNHLFHTNFKEMDAYKGRNQTTQGIWIEKCAGVLEPFIIAMDLEGTDGRERGEDDTAFEKQSALFALAIADIVIINMWCHDVGRVQAANKPLLRIVFQVMMRLFGARKKTLQFVLRDKTETPLAEFERILRKDVEEIWNSIRKPTSHSDTPLSEFFNVEVIALSSYKYEKELFKEEVAQLRLQLLKSISPRGLPGDRHGVLPASEFSFSAQEIWKSIKENKDLDLPAHKVLVSKYRCREIVNQKLRQLFSDEDWLALKRPIDKSVPVSGFGSKLSSILETCFSEYDKEAFYFDEGVRNEKRKQLESEALSFAHPTYLKLLECLRKEALKNSKSRLKAMMNEAEKFAASAKSCTHSAMLEFDQRSADAAITQANWDNSEVRGKLFHDVNESFESLADVAVWSQMKVRYEQVNKALSKQLESLFEIPVGDTWTKIRELLSSATETAVSKFSADISGLELDPAISNKMVQYLREYARTVVEKKAREEAGKVLYRMKVRYLTILNDACRKKKSTIVDARIECLKILSVMAAIRLDEKPDEIEKILVSSLMNKRMSSETLASSGWKEVSPNDTLITPVKCKSVWQEFQTETAQLTHDIEVAIKTEKWDKVRGIVRTAASVAGVATSVAGIVIPIVLL